MSQINDAIREAVGADQINDGLLLYYQANGAKPDTNALQDAEEEFLISNTNLTPTSLQDKWVILLESLGFTGSLDDQRLAFWEGGGSVIPLGVELITNGGFGSGASWTNLQNVTIAGGVATFTATPNDLRQEAVGIVNGTTYRIAILVSGGTFNGLGMGIQLGSNTSLARIDSDGPLIVDITADGANDRFRLRSSGPNTFTGTIDNISVRELL